MSLDIQQREREGITILDLKGRLTVGDEVSKFRDRLQKLIESGYRSLILNMEQVDYIDSTGLGALVMCYTTLQRAGGKIRLLNLSRRSIELLVMTKLTTIFEVFDDEQNAINSFFPDRELKRFDILNFVQQMKED
ncbi:MAG TPA: STAS domain-containing protein [Bryobacteraceae bacterium]|nr:STAS domain-containing protein [Bryobacteraceae bacterium]